MAYAPPTRRGVLITWGVAAGVLGALVLGGLLRLRNDATRRQNEAAARAALRRTAMAVVAPLQLDQPKQVAPALRTQLHRRGVRQVVLLAARSASRELPFVREVRLVAASDPKLAPGRLRGQPTGRSAAGAKALYDWGERVLLARGTDLRWDRAGGDGGETLEVGRRLRIRGTDYLLGVRFAPVHRPLAVPVLWVILALLLGLAVPFGEALAVREYRWLAVGAGIALMGAASGLILAGYQAVVTLPEASQSQGALFGAAIQAWVPSGGVGLAWGVVTALLLVLPWLGARGTGRRFAESLRENRVAYAYILPAAAGMLVLVLVPFLIGLGLGFFNHCDGHYDWVGLGNFWSILSGDGRSLTDPLNFWFTLAVTLAWTFLNVLFHVSIGLALALLLKDPLLGGKGIYRVLLIIPWAVPNYITALMWKGMFHQQFGAVNQLLGLVGIGGVSWFSHFWSAFTANVITNTWLGFPFMMVVALGALQSIPGELYEAAEVDGASRWTQFREITLPLLKPALLPAVILGSIWTFNQFNIIYLVSGGEPAGSTDILITEAYRWAFIRHERYGLAAAYATLIFLILLGYTLITNRISKRAEGAMDG